jgi:hypothetical protein
MPYNTSSNTPPMMTSPVSSSASPTTSISSNSAHPLKKRLISEYEHEQQQQRNSPAHASSVIRALTPSEKFESTTVNFESTIEDVSDAETTKDVVNNTHEETDASA